MNTDNIKDSVIKFKNFPDVLNIKEMCQLLNISTKTGYKIIKQGGIKCFKIGRAYRIPKKNVFEYLNLI